MRAVAIILYDKDKRILLQHRTNDAPYSLGKWGFFGGGITKNETLEECVIRECFEELSYELKNPKLIYEKRIYLILKQYVFIEKYDDSKKLILGEGKEFGWFKTSEVDKLDIIPFVRKIIKKIAPMINNQT